MNEVPKHNEVLISSDDPRVNEILNVILSYARLDFSISSSIEGDGSPLDAVASGVNMLGEELRASTISLREKDQLLKEIHHRVKNNLQIIHSLLNLQTDFISDEKQLAILRDCQNRIKSMALVHEMLYATPDLSGISLNEYINSLLQHLSFTYVKPIQNIEINHSTPIGVYLKMDQMVPLALVMNEIISNSLKHAFMGGSGRIEVLTEVIENNLKISIADNGVGLPDGFDVHRDGNLGMQLIFLLSEQINANVEVNSNKGLKYHLIFEI